MTGSACPYCGVFLAYHHHRLDRPERPERPSLGALTVCQECGAVSIWWDQPVLGLSLRRLTPGEAREISAQLLGYLRRFKARIIGDAQGEVA